MDRVFLDANIIFSAAYRQDSRLNILWSFQDIELVTSNFAAEEAKRNLRIHKPEAISQMETLMETVVLLSESENTSDLQKEIKIAEKRSSNTKCRSQCQMHTFNNRRLSAFWPPFWRHYPWRQNYDSFSILEE